VTPGSVVLFALLGKADARRAAPDLSLVDRCALVRAIVNVQASQGQSPIPIPWTPPVKRSFAERRDVDDMAGIRDRILTRLLWDAGYPPRKVVRYGFTMEAWDAAHRPHTMFAPGESCADDDFLLEGELTPGEVGQTEYLVEITIKRASKRENDRFSFVEGFDLYGPRLKGGFVIPPLKYFGTVAKNAGGAWTATVSKVHPM
jgi:hypothetical protein